MPSFATQRRHRLGWKTINVDLSFEAWKRVNLAALNSNPPLSQSEYLRRVLATVEPIEADQSGGADQAAEAR